MKFSLLCIVLLALFGLSAAALKDSIDDIVVGDTQIIPNKGWIGGGQLKDSIDDIVVGDTQIIPNKGWIGGGQLKDYDLKG